MVLCPTTILAEQHYETFFSRFAPFDLKVAVLSRFVTPAQQRKTLEGFADGSVNVLIGTHRLLSADVNPYDLGLVIIDEEQRFGVQHKEQLKNMVSAALVSAIERERPDQQGRDSLVPVATDATGREAGCLCSPVAAVDAQIRSREGAPGRQDEFDTLVRIMHTDSFDGAICSLVYLYVTWISDSGSVLARSCPHMILRCEGSLGEPWHFLRYFKVILTIPMGSSIIGPVKFCETAPLNCLNKFRNGW